MADNFATDEYGKVITKTFAANEDAGNILHQLVQVEYENGGLPVAVTPSAGLPVLVTNPSMPAALGSGGGLKVDPSDGVSLPVAVVDLNTLATEQSLSSMAGDIAILLSRMATIGASSWSIISTAAVISANISPNPGQIYDMQFFNKAATPAYVRLYNKATEPTTSDTPIWRGIIPGNTEARDCVVSFPYGKTCAIGIGIRVTAAIADNDTTALGANEFIGNIGYL